MTTTDDWFLVGIDPYKSRLFADPQSVPGEYFVCRRARPGARLMLSHLAECPSCGEKAVVKSVDKWRMSGRPLICHICHKNGREDEMRRAIREDNERIEHLKTQIFGTSSEQLETLTTAHSDSPWPEIYLGLNIREMNGRRLCDVSTARFRSAAQKAGDDPRAFCWKPFVFSISRDETLHAEAVKDLQRAIELYPEYAAGYKYLANELAGMSEFHEAVEVLRVGSIRASPNEGVTELYEQWRKSVEASGH